MEWEVHLIEGLQKSLGSLTGPLGSALSFIGGEMGLLLVVLIVLFCWNKEFGKRLAVVVIAVNAWMPMLKAVVMRPRPYMEYPDRITGIADAGSSGSMKSIAAQGYSFPSLHSSSVVALTVTIASEVKKRWAWILAVVASLLVGVSRAVTGMHYPTDILAGWALGLVSAGACMLLEKKVGDERTRHLVLLASVLPGLLYVRTDDYFTALGLMVGLIVAIRFEEKHVNFSDTRNAWAMAARLVGAFAIFFALNTLLKTPFGKEFLEGGTLAALLVRSSRYGIIMFVILGLFPKAFPLFEKLGNKRAE